MSDHATTLREKLKALELAIASGESRVKYADREVQYKGTDEMIKARNEIRKILGINGGIVRLKMATDKGLK
jgi:hypothetical protein